MSNVTLSIRSFYLELKFKTAIILEKMFCKIIEYIVFRYTMNH